MLDLKTEKHNFKLIWLAKGTKNKPVHKYKDIQNLQDYIPPVKEYNYAIATGKINKIIVVDIDSYKEEFKTKSDFTKVFKNYIEEFNTYTIKSAKGGHHFYFNYDEEIKQIASDVYIDIRSDGGYIVGEGSKIEEGTYTIIKDIGIRNIPENLKKWLLDNLYKKKSKIVKRSEDNEEVDEVNEVKEVKYLENLKDNEITNLKKNIIKKLEINKKIDNFFGSYNEFLYFTTAMKKLDLQKSWDDFNKTQKNYDYEANMKIWNSVHNLDFTLWLKKRLNFSVYDLIKPTLKNTIKPSQIINKEKLGNIFEDEFNYIIKSDTGTGKTTSFMNYIKNNKYRFLSITSRKSLAYEQYINFCENNIDCVNYDIDEIEDQQSAICQLDSITKLYNIKNFSNYVLFLDEFNSIISYLIQSSTLKNHRINVFTLLIRLIKECKQFICVDADISDMSIKFIDFCSRKYKFIKNDYLHNNNVKAEEVHDFDEFVEKIKSDKKFMLCCDSKSQAEVIFKKLNDENVKLITSDTNDEFIKLDDYEKVIFSPKIIYGLDSTMKRNVYCIYTEKTISPTSYIQQIARCRNIEKLFFIFTNKKYKENYDTFSDVKEKLKKVNDYSLKEFKFLTTQENYNLYFELVCIYDYNNDCYNTNKFGHFINLLKLRGFDYKEEREFVSIDKFEIKKIKAGIKKEKLENFDINENKNKKINGILKVPEDEIDKYKDFFLNPYLLMNHFSISKFYKDNDKDLKEELNLKDEFNLNKIKSTENKLKFLMLLKRLTYNNDIFSIDSKPAIMTDINKLNEEYKVLFGKKNNINLNNIYECNKVQYKLYKEIFKRNLSELNVCEKVRIQQDKKREFKYTVNKKYFDKDLELLKFRFNPLQDKLKKKVKIV
jgi:hypothetical protein